ncbi:hypothetical protein AB0L00_23465 [Actinoallomurus sp. NPDC052308]|uniref:hypothetical protein n=1 Tax=Actinoallomurus sp. NPDC052308 TaxID=3155530 RepID=UPI003415EF9D
MTKSSEAKNTGRTENTSGTPRNTTVDRKLEELERTGRTSASDGGVFLIDLSSKS